MLPPCISNGSLSDCAPTHSRAAGGIFFSYDQKKSRSMGVLRLMSTDYASTSAGGASSDRISW